MLLKEYLNKYNIPEIMFLSSKNLVILIVFLKLNFKDNLLIKCIFKNLMYKK